MNRTASGKLSELIRDIKPDFLDRLVLTDPGEGEGEGDGGEGEGEGEGEEGGEGASGTGTGDGEGKDPVRDPEKKRLSDEAAKYRNERNDLKKQLDSVQQQLKEFTDKDKSESDRLSEERDTLLAERDALQKEVNESRLLKAFVFSGAAAMFADQDDGLLLLEKRGAISPDEDGQYDHAAIKEATEKLLKEKPQYAASSSSGDDDSGSPGSGGSPSNGSKNRRTTAEANREKLAKRFPALRR